MKQKKYTKRALCMSLLSMLLCCSMLIGTTFAWFTDSVTSGHNHIVAGNLDVELTHTNANVTTETKVDGTTELFRDVNGDPIKWEPGVIAYENFTVRNEGSLALEYVLSLSLLDKNYVVEVSGEETTYSLTDVVKVAVISGSFSDTTRDNVVAGTYPLSDFDTVDETGVLYPAGSSSEPSEETFAVVLYWEPSENDDLYNLKNGKSATQSGQTTDVTTDALFMDLGVELLATQTPYEKDSFDENYDDEAKVEIKPVEVTPDETKTVNIGTAEELAGALGNTGVKTINLIGNIDLTDKLWVPINRWYPEEGTPLTINGNGHKIINMTVDTEGNSVGMISSVGVGLTVNDLTFESPEVTSTGIYVGVVVGYQYGPLVLNNVHVNDATVISTAEKGIDIGALVGYSVQNDGATLTINNCSVTDSTFVGYHSVGAILGRTNVDNNDRTTINNTTITGNNIYGTSADGMGAHAVGVGTNGYKDCAYTGTGNTISGNVVKSVSAIRTAEDLTKFSEDSNSGIFGGEVREKVAVLMDDVDMSGVTDFMPINGQFVYIDGLGHTISNLTCTSNSLGKSGLVGYLGGGWIKNLTLRNVKATGAQAGAFAGQMEGGKLIDCTLTGTNTITYENEVGETYGGIGYLCGVHISGSTFENVSVKGTNKLENESELSGTMCKKDTDNYGYTVG